MGGYPLVVRKEANVTSETLEKRGFATTNIVSMAEILKNKKHDDIYDAFLEGNRTMERMVTKEPNKMEFDWNE